MVDNSFYLCQGYGELERNVMSDKQQLLISTALDLFYKNGINSVGINEVLKVSGVAKKTLYRYFDSKDALIIATLDQRHNIFISWLQSSVENSVDNKEFIQKLFSALTRWFNNQVPALVDFRGCYFINTAAEFTIQNEEISDCCQQHKKNVRLMLKTQMPIFEQSLFELICMLKEGAITSAYISQDLDAAEKCIAWALAHRDS